MLTGPGFHQGAALRVNGVHDVQLQGFAVRGPLQGVMVKGSSRVSITGLTVRSTGYEGIHVYARSSWVVIQHNDIADTGSKDVAFGEGIYVGTSPRRWDVVTQGQPDSTKHIAVLGNRIENAGAEPIEAKAGTAYGVIQGNTLQGHQPGSRAIGWILVTGDHWLIRDNRGTDGVTNGYVLMQQSHRWGHDNAVVDNTGVLNASGWGVLVQKAGAPQPPGTVVKCNNTVTDAGAGARSIPCQR